MGGGDGHGAEDADPDEGGLWACGVYALLVGGEVSPGGVSGDGLGELGVV